MTLPQHHEGTMGADKRAPLIRSHWCQKLTTTGHLIMAPKA